MSTYKKILVPIDASQTAQSAAAQAAALARDQQAAIRFVVVVEANGLLSSSPEFLNVLGNDARLLLDRWVNEARAPGMDVSSAVVETTQALPRVADAILAEGHRWGADLIVIGSHGRSGVRRMILGSVAEGVSQRSTVPVLIVHAGEPKV
ncbi:Universal stress protein [Thiomonas arsenitoxydans]|jgi:nucleotide-binding universal stress UspA family protein|uniref:Universal stress protein n=1 Tax=Thiomonas arsenitoxydans (strain DSM 22701 / CIP 110005 / 3As) TaxID=426114 RepID=D6CUC2_THIA3|nr:MULTISPECIES: universal stress protein [Thiomonas]CAZ88891.1 putative universal stress protein family UspA [Thiomonas arsenitoxydans]CQR29257.1 Universal stress protein [Thiomonas arsenitoxydans]CQR35223.1 Universal stress protein [Thiomonas arsenitoxydans]CQR35669.1 Universal stress protein [Thiomonas arsenitoxydans]CQR35757.1 Universal stress protein [Thiomonas arsenitoxydans]